MYFEAERCLEHACLEEERIKLQEVIEKGKAEAQKRQQQALQKIHSEQEEIERFRLLAEDQRLLTQQVCSQLILSLQNRRALCSSLLVCLVTKG